METTITGQALTVVGLFARAGGIEVGLREAGHRTEMLCERDESARRVLAHRFPEIPLWCDVAELQGIPEVDLLCQRRLDALYTITPRCTVSYAAWL